MSIRDITRKVKGRETRTDKREDITERIKKEINKRKSNDE